MPEGSVLSSPLASPPVPDVAVVLTAGRREKVEGTPRDIRASFQSGALLCFLLTDRVALRFWCPNTPGSFGFCKERTSFSISRRRFRGGGF